DREAYPSSSTLSASSAVKTLVSSLENATREPRRSFTRESPAPLGAAGVSPGAFRGALCALKDKPWVSGRQANSVLPQARGPRQTRCWFAGVEIGAKPNGGATNKTIFMLVWEPCERAADCGAPRTARILADWRAFAVSRTTQIASVPFFLGALPALCGKDPCVLSRKCNREPRRSFTRESPAPLGAAGVSPGAFRGALCALKDKPWVSGRQANSVLPQAGAKPNGGATNKTIFMLVWEPWFGTTLWLVLALLSATERGPALQHARVALFPLHQLRRHLEPVLDLNIKKELGLVVKADGNVVVLVGAVE